MYEPATTYIQIKDEWYKSAMPVIWFNFTKFPTPLIRLSDGKFYWKGYKQVMAENYDKNN